MKRKSNNSTFFSYHVASLYYSYSTKQNSHIKLYKGLFRLMMIVSCAALLCSCGKQFADQRASSEAADILIKDVSYQDGYFTGTIVIEPAFSGEEALTDEEWMEAYQPVISCGSWDQVELPVVTGSVRQEEDNLTIIMEFSIYLTTQLKNADTASITISDVPDIFKYCF